MQEKHIVKNLNKRVSEWLDSIKDKEVREKAMWNTLVAGGAITSLMMNEDPHDLDIYFRNKETVKAVAEYYAGRWNQAHENQENNLGRSCKVFMLDGEDPSVELLDYFRISTLEESAAVIISSTTPDRIKMVFPSDGITGDQPDPVQEVEAETPSPVKNLENADETPDPEKVKADKYEPVFITSNAISLKGTVQLVVRFYGEPDEIHENFDYEHTKACYDYGKNTLTIPKSVYECVINKNLKYTGSRYPVCSLFRLRKFLKRGWTVNAGQIFKMAVQVNELDLQDPAVLEDQLVGVDTVYFTHLINIIREEVGSGGVTRGYLMSVIDRIF